MKQKWNLRLFIFLIGIISLLIAFPTKVSAANRPVGDEFVSYVYNLKCRVLTSGSASSLGTVEVTGVEGAEIYITIPDTVTVYDEHFDFEDFTVVSIAPGAFKGNKFIRSISISSTSHVSTIPQNCCTNCINLTSVSLYNVKTVGANAFSGCKRLQSLGVYDDALKKIEKNAFKNCKKLDYFTIHDSKLKSVGKNAFKGTKNHLTIYTKYRKNYNLVKKSGGTKNLRFIDMSGWD